jgi:hypothetical protein
MLMSVVQVHLRPPNKKTRNAQALRVFSWPAGFPGPTGKIRHFIHSLWIHTMNRCISLLTTILALGLLAAGAQAQTTTSRKEVTLSDGTVAVVRTFPGNISRGTLVVQTPPDVLLDDKADRLSPGSRIRGANGMLTLSASLVGQTLSVVYTREPNGMLHDVWVLTEVEAQVYATKPAYSN